MSERLRLDELDDIDRLIVKHILINAVKHGGKASIGPVINKVLGSRPDLKPRAREVAERIRRFIEVVNSMDTSSQRALLNELDPSALAEKDREETKELPELPNASIGKVVTRFAPNPDYALHLGNARPAVLSYIYGKEIYRGRMILRFEDTDPRIKRPLPEAYIQIKEDLRWLGVKWDEEYIQSLRMEIYYDLAKKLIEVSGAYIDLCSQEEFRKYRSSRKPCPHRERSPEDNLELFDKMLSGHFGEGEAVVRVKTDLNDPDPSIVDWVAFRIIDTDRYPHPLTGDRYIVWPTYNFASAVDDKLMGVTHILRAREHQQNTKKQIYLYRHLGWRYPEVIHFGRLKLQGFILSKSRIKKLTERYPDRFSGPNDPRFGTLAGLRERGILAETILEIVRDVGIKPTDASISWDNIAALNRKKLDYRSRRLMYVEDPVKICIEDAPRELSSIEARYHPDNDKLGSRILKLIDNDGKLCVYVSRSDIDRLLGRGDSAKVRFMELANVEVYRSGENGAAARYISRDLDDAKRMRLKIIQWVGSNSVNAIVKYPVGLRFRVSRGLIEGSILGLNDHVYQLVRYGFVKVLRKTPKGAVLLYIHE